MFRNVFQLLSFIQRNQNLVTCGLHMVRIVRGTNSQWYEKSSNLVGQWNAVNGEVLGCMILLSFALCTVSAF